jgi:hypothetical protein
MSDQTQQTDGIIARIWDADGMHLEAYSPSGATGTRNVILVNGKYIVKNTYGGADLEINPIGWRTNKTVDGVVTEHAFEVKDFDHIPSSKDFSNDWQKDAEDARAKATEAVKKNGSQNNNSNASNATPKSPEAPKLSPAETANKFQEIAKNYPQLNVSTEGGYAVFKNPTTGVPTRYTDPIKAENAVKAWQQAQTFGDNELSGFVPGSYTKLSADSNVGIRMNKNWQYEVYDTESGRTLSKGSNQDMMYDRGYAAAEGDRILAEQNGTTKGGRGGPAANNQTGPGGKQTGPIKIEKSTAIMGVASLGLFAYGAFQAFRGSESAGKAFGALIPGLLGIYTQTRPLFKSLESTWAHADMMTLATVVAIMVAMWALSKAMPKKDKTLPPGVGPTNTASPTAGNTTSTTSGTTPKAWFDWLPQNAIFYILPSIAVLAIGAGGLNVDPKSSNFWLDSRVKIQQSELAATVKTLKSDVTEPGKVTEDLIGKVFVKKGDAVRTPDLAVFVTRDTDGKLNFNKVSLSRAGYLVSWFSPKINNLPFFISTDKTVSPNPDAFTAVQVELSEAEAANSGIHPESAAVATQLAAAANKVKK